MKVFDEVVTRKNTKSEKWDNIENVFGTKEALPMWVADTDFRVADPIVQAIAQRAKHPIYGYTILSDSFYNSIIDFVKRHHKWEIKKEWINITTGVMAGVVLALKVFTQPGDEVIIQTPVYTPFFTLVKKNKRVVSENPLLETTSGFMIDFIDLEEKMKTAKALLLCNPHNPTGRVFTHEELNKITSLAEKYQVRLISDEIHSDIIYEGYTHIPLATISPYSQENSIIMIAPSKTFNIPGLGTSVAIIPNQKIREAFAEELSSLGIAKNVFGIEALEVAYSACDDWLAKANIYIAENRQLVLTYLEENLPLIKCQPAQGTFLMWLDLKAYGEHQSIQEQLLFKGKLALSDGLIYGSQGEGFFRLNIGCPRATLLEGLRRLTIALK